MARIKERYVMHVHFVHRIVKSPTPVNSHESTVNVTSQTRELTSGSICVTKFPDALTSLSVRDYKAKEQIPIPSILEKV